MSRSLRRAIVGLLAAASISVLACGSNVTLLLAGTTCTSDQDCAIGLGCLPIGLQNDAGACQFLADVCSKICRDDYDCAAVGLNFRCFPCHGSGTCGRTQ